MTDMTTLYSGTMQVPERHQFDVGVLQAYLGSRIPDFAGPLAVELFKGGQSNPTYKLITPSRTYAMRAKPGPVAKLLRSAIANAQQKDGFGGDVDRLFVAACYANQGPSMKRIRPAPMGRAFRVVKRTAHLTVRVAERPLQIAAAAADSAPKRGRAKAQPAVGAKAKAPVAKRAAPAKKAAAKKK